MAELRALFEALRFRDVETVIASGNVLFDSPSADPAALEQRIEKRLRTALGYDVETFLRTGPELAAIVDTPAFGPEDPVIDGDAVQVIFLRSELSAGSRERVLALSTDLDAFRVRGREVYWRRRGRITDSKITPAMFGRAFDSPGTARNVTTVRKLAAKLAR